MATHNGKDGPSVENGHDPDRRVERKGEPEVDREVDRELLAFVQKPVAEGKRARGHLDPRRLILTSATVFGIAWLLVPTTDELAYHFTKRELQDLGEATDVVNGRALPLDAFVRVHGVLGNKAAVFNGIRPGTLRRGPIQVRQVLGAPIFVELDQEKHPDLAMTGDFPAATLEGRVHDFGPGSDMAEVRKYFTGKLGLEVPDDARLIVVDERPGAMWLYPISWALGLAAALVSLFFLWKSTRPRLVDDDVSSAAEGA